MSQSLPARRDHARPRFRGTISMVLMILLAAMIVRDILVRRLASSAPSATDVTRRVP